MPDIVLSNRSRSLWQMPPIRLGWITRTKAKLRSAIVISVKATI